MTEGDRRHPPPKPDDLTADLTDNSRASALDGLIASTAAAPQVQRVGPWRILETLGEGGMGVVYLAEQTEPVRRRVALKLIKRGMDTKEVLARFDRERQALALMDHPHIATVLDAGAAEDGRPYFVMELVRGLPLCEYCDRHKLSVKERLALFEQVCHAVQHAHHKGIIHRDLKPTNILVSSSGEAPLAKIIDFGVARAVQRSSLDNAYTELGQMIGTPAYMSPEQADMSTEDIDTRSDIYSLGVVLYELLVGAPPFDANSLRKAGFDEIRRAIREAEPMAPSTRLRHLREESTGVAERRKSTINYLTREIRGDLDWITLKALEKDRTRRYSTASELAADVRRYLLLEPVLARRAGTLHRLRKLIRRRRTAFISTSAAALLLLGTAIAIKVATERSLRVAGAERSRSLRAEGEAAGQEYLQRTTRLAQLTKKLDEKISKHETWAPIWERQSELQSFEELEQAGKEAVLSGGQAELAFTAAIGAAPHDSLEALEGKRSLETYFFQLYQDALTRSDTGLEPRDYYRLRAQAIGLGTYERAFSGWARVSISSEPPGARVYCFRYVASEGRLVPVPFDYRAGNENPARGLLAVDFLRVERVVDGASPFQPGDQLLEVAGKKVSSLTSFAAALYGIPVDASVKVALTRQGEHLTLDWTPFPSACYNPAGPLKPPYRPDRLLDTYQQLGVRFEAYPLDFPDASLLGTAGPGAPVDVELPAGSYLLVLRHDGRVDTRFPVAVCETAATETVRLLEPSDVPPGFVYVPEGPVCRGGDPEAFNSMERGVDRVPDFFISRFELTTDEYLKFVNDPEVRGRTNEEGFAIPAVEEVQKELQRAFRPLSEASTVPGAARERPVQLIPRWVNRPQDRDRDTIWDRADGIWQLPADWPALRPILGIPQLAAIEYAHWRTKKEAGSWRYRLPTDIEWEKAARGVDRRRLVWGDYFVWSFCWSGQGLVGGGRARPPEAAGAFPIDESVYGVRDLAGSAAEHTISRPIPGRSLATVRGGHWLSIDRQDFRAATRNTLDPIHNRLSSGIRLAAEKATQ